MNTSPDFLLQGLAIGALGGWAMTTFLLRIGRRRKRKTIEPAAPIITHSYGLRLMFFEMEYNVPDEWSDEKAVEQAMMFCSVLLDAYTQRDAEQYYHRAAQVRDFMRGCPTYLPGARAKYRTMKTQMEQQP
jgi:hypothetical protein